MPLRSVWDRDRKAGLIWKKRYWFKSQVFTEIGRIKCLVRSKKNWEVSRIHRLWGSIDLVRKSSAAHECQVSTWWLWIFSTDTARLPQICNFSSIGIKTCGKFKKCYIKELQPLQRVGSRRLHQKAESKKRRWHRSGKFRCWCDVLCILQ